jgi:hypothetical protein
VTASWVRSTPPGWVASSLECSTPTSSALNGASNAG